MRAEAGGYSCSKLLRSVLAVHVMSHGGRRLLFGASPGRRGSLSWPSVLSCAFPTLPVPLHAPPPRLSRLWLFHWPRRLAAAQMCLYARERGWTGRLVLPSQPRGANWERGSRSSLFPPSAVGPSSVPGGMLRSAHEAAAAAGVGCAGYQPCRTSEGLLGGGQGTSLLPGWGIRSPARSLSFLLTPAEVAELGGEDLGEESPLQGPRLILAESSWGDFEALLVPCHRTESPALSLRLFGAQHWAWRGQRVAMGGLMFLCQIKLC